MHVDWQVKHYNDLSLNEFHDLIALRIAVFVIEQNCPYQELDGKDKKSYHLICRNGNGTIVSTARIIPPGIAYPQVAIGRVVADASARGLGLGHELMRQCMRFIVDEFGKVPVILSAQKHLENYYASHGFVSTGKEYLEDNIPHVEMIYTPKEVH
jgi:ElaA protein